MSTIRAPRGTRYGRGGDGSDPRNLTDVWGALTARPRVPARKASRGERPKPPLNDRQKAVLALLEPEEQRARELTARSGLSPSQLGSVLYALQARDLAVHTDKGWRAV